MSTTATYEEQIANLKDMNPDILVLKTNVGNKQIPNVAWLTGYVDNKISGGGGTLDSYLTKSEASNTYATKTDLSDEIEIIKEEYLSNELASEIYLQQEDAANTYATISNVYSKTDADSKFMLKTDTPNMDGYLPLTAGSNKVLTGSLYTNAATPYLIGTAGKVGIRANKVDGSTYASQVALSYTNAELSDPYFINMVANASSEKQTSLRLGVQDDGTYGLTYKFGSNVYNIYHTGNLDLTPYAWIHAPANLVSALTTDLLNLLQADGEYRIQRPAESSERTVFDSIYQQLKNGERVAGLIIAYSNMCAYLQFTLLNDPDLTFTVMNVGLGAASYGYVVEYNFNTKILLSEKIRLTTQSDLGKYATTGSVQEVKNAVEAIKDRITYITYAELKALRDEGNLTPGQQYQITDYITQIQPGLGLKSAGHQFDIIVVADTSYSLNEKARAVLHNASSAEKIEGWPEDVTLEDVQPLYEFTPFDSYKEEPDNGDLHLIQVFDMRNGIPVLINCDTEGTSRYVNHVADIKFVITDEEEVYEDWISAHQDLIVELDYNEDGVPILYKNNPMNPDVASIFDADYGDRLEYYDDYEFEGEVYNRWKKWDESEEDYYPIYILTNVIVENNHFTITQEELISDIGFEYVPSEFDAFYEYSGLYEFDGETYNLWLDKESGSTYYGILTKKIFNVNEYFGFSNLNAWEIKYTISNNKFNWTATDGVGTGTIYWMKDEFNNECPYDFKNIMFNDPTDTYDYVYTFSSGASDASLTGSVYNNIIRPAEDINKIILQGYAKNNIFEPGCYEILIKDNAINNHFGSNCHNISLKSIDNCIFQNGCYQLTCDQDMYNVKAENGVHDLTIESSYDIYNIILTAGVCGSQSNNHTITVSTADASKNTQTIYRPYYVTEILLDY